MTANSLFSADQITVLITAEVDDKVHAWICTAVVNVREENGLIGFQILDHNLPKPLGIYDDDDARVIRFHRSGGQLHIDLGRCHWGDRKPTSDSLVAQMTPRARTKN